MIENDEQLLFVRYWERRFDLDGIAAEKGLCFRLLTTKARRTFKQAAAAAAAQLREHITEYEKRKRTP